MRWFGKHKKSEQVATESVTASATATAGDRPVRFRPVIRVFVSSTFTDLKQERDALQQKVFPELEQLCASRRFQFQAIDLRWGVPTEANLDHRTMRICFEELRRAQEISPQPNFLVLLGNRYGWRPLPEEVLPDEFRLLEQKAQTAQERDVLHAWYRRDDNAIPPVYLLQSRKQDLGDKLGYCDEEVWGGVQKVLWEVINRAYPTSELTGRFATPTGPDQPLPSIVRFQTSATEQEIWRGALGVPNAAQHVLAFVREIQDIQPSLGTANAGDFVDVDGSGQIDAVPQLALSELKQALRARVGEANYHEFRQARLVESKDAKGGRCVDVTTEHLDEMCAQVNAGLRPIITRQMDEYWQTTAVEVPPARELQLEQNEHRRFGQERAPAASFVGREEQLKAIRDCLSGDSRQLVVIHGASGCGKTALLARAAQEAESRWQPIVRFIGVTPQSSDIRALLSSLCRELRERHPPEKPIPEDIGDLTSEFHQHLYAATAKRPVVLFLDALDQLADVGAGRLLQWLPTGDLPPHVKLVLSCLSDRPQNDPTGEPYLALKRRELTQPEFLNLDALPEEEARTLLFERWLPQAGRRLSPSQTQCIRQRLRSEACRQPLYLRILFEEARLWRSYDSPPQLLAGTVSELINALLERLAEPGNHGPLVETALGYIASARRGLAETEILEVLYDDPEYRQFLESGAAQTGHKLPDNPPRIPIAAWSRLRFDLAPYLAEHAAPGATVVNFYHRQVDENVRAKYLADPGKQQQRHRRLAAYFRRRADPDDDSTWAGCCPRGVSELPYHQTHALLLEEVCRTLGDLAFVARKCQSGLTYDLMLDYDVAISAVARGECLEKDRLARELGEWHAFCARECEFFAHFAPALPQVVLQQAHNTPYFPLVAAAANKMASSERTAEGTWFRLYEVEHGALLYQTTACYSRHIAYEEHHRYGYTQWVTAISPLSTSRFVCGYLDGMLAVWNTATGVREFFGRAHGHGIYSMHVLNKQRLATGGGPAVPEGQSEPIRVWDTERGTVLMEFAGHRDKTLCLASWQGRYLLSGGTDRIVKMWDLRGHSEPVHQFEEHAETVTDIRVLKPDILVTVSTDGTLVLRDLNQPSAVLMTPPIVSTQGDHPISVSPDGRLFTTSKEDGSLVCWGDSSHIKQRLAEAGRRASPKLEPELAYESPRGEWTWLDHCRIFALSENPIVVDLASGSIARGSARTRQPYKGLLRLNPDEVVSAEVDGSIWRWDVRTLSGVKIETLPRGNAEVMVPLDSRHILVGVGQGPEEVYMIDTHPPDTRPSSANFVYQLKPDPSEYALVDWFKHELEAKGETNIDVQKLYDFAVQRFGADGLGDMRRQKWIDTGRRVTLNGEFYIQVHALFYLEDGMVKAVLPGTFMSAGPAGRDATRLELRDYHRRKWWFELIGMDKSGTPSPLES